MKPTRFTSLAPTEEDKMSRNTFKSPQTPQPTNTRWKRAEDDMHSNPFRRERRRQFTGSPPPKQPMNSRWQRDTSDESDNQSRGSGGFPNSFRGRGDRNRDRGDRGRGSRGRDRGDRGDHGRFYSRDRDGGSFNSFNRKTKRAPKPIFKLESTNFPPLGMTGGSSSRPKMDFSKAANKNKNLPGPKHITQHPERMPRTKKLEVDDRDPLDWNTDDEEGGCHEQTDDGDEPDWPAKGGYID